jgi:hypothetical protein
MANKTFLELTNEVLVRLREDEVQTISQNSYSKLMAQFINDGKRQVEDAWNWNCLRNVITVTTANGVTNYTLTGSGTRFKVLNVVDDTNDQELELYGTNYASGTQFTDPQSGNPSAYNFNGVDSNNDTKVDLFPTPTSVLSIKFNLYRPQSALVNNSDVLIVPNEPVIFYAYARALAERGEDGGLSSGEAYQLYQQSLADHIAIEAGRSSPDLLWDAV